MCRGLKNKDATTVTAAMEDIFTDSKRKPKNIHSDKGKEFYNKTFQELMTTNNINHYSSHSIIKCSFVERVNRTFRNMMMKFLHERGTSRWINHLSTLVDKYNSKKHRTIKTAPKNINKENEKEILEKIYAEKNNKRCLKPKYKIGDPVRLNLTRKTFNKESSGSFTHEIYYVSKVNEQSYPCTYNLINVDKRPMLGRVYNEDITLVHRPSLYLIQKIVRQKDGKCLVRFEGFDEETDEWMDEKDIHEVQYNF